MTEVNKTVFWFKTDEINKKWDEYSSLLESDVITELPYRDTTFVLISENYFLEKLFTKTHYLSSSFLSQHDIHPGQMDIPEIFDKIREDRFSFFIKSQVYNNPEQVNSSLEVGFKKFLLL